MNQTEEKLLSLIEEGELEKALSSLRKKEFKTSVYYSFFMGEIYRIKGFFYKAASNYESFLKCRDIDIRYRIESLNKLSACYRALGDYEKSNGYIKQAMKLSERNKIKLDDTLIEMAMVHRLKGNFKEAINIFNYLKRKFLSRKDYAAISYINWSIGGIYRLKGDFKNSIDSFIQAKLYAKKAGDNDLLVYSLFGLAGVLRISGDIEGSYLNYKKAKAIISSDDFFAIAYSYCGMGNALRQLGRLNEAEGMYKRSFKYYSLIGDKVDLGFVCWGLGEIYKKKGYLNKALGYFNKAGVLFKKGLEKRGEILNMISTSQLLYLFGEKNKANTLYFKALKIAKKEKLNTYLEIFT